jgi:hypothetical protein
LLHNAPDAQDGYIKVPAILDNGGTDAEWTTLKTI